MTHHTHWAANTDQWADAQSVRACAQPMPGWAPPGHVECLDKFLMRNERVSSGYPDKHTHQSIVV